ncbi:hypothetical protein BC938DRAFT_476480 [Jimgerdemannia flammicorona]|uniref:Uncharacterized protein n=1 Tax=Jimgerdemannia flammicorona TaxID=994334 RepID=A0A433PGQ7_9FUNG|nr:hypothetical protein BC938DRAFT_476480 [Jimgerdemannia flammicorona]
MLCGLIYSFNILTVKDPIQLRLKAGRVISFPNDDSNPSSPAPQSPSFHYDNDLVRRASSLPSSPTPRFATLNGPVFGASTSYADRSTFGTSSPAHHFATEDTSSPFARAQPTQTQTQTQTSNDYGMMDWAPTSVPAFLAAPQPRVPTQRVFGDLRNEAILSANANLGSGLLRSSSAGASTGGEMFASTANGFGLGAGSAGRSSGTRENHFRHRTNRGTDADVGALVNGFIGGTNNEERDWEMAPQRFFAPEKPTGLEDMFTASFKIQDESTFVRTLKMLNQQLHGQGRVAKRVILMAAMIPLQAIYILFLGHALRLLVGYEQCLLHGNEAIDRSQKERNQAAVRGAPGLQDRQGVARRASKMENRKVATRHLTMTVSLAHPHQPARRSPSHGTGRFLPAYLGDVRTPLSGFGASRLAIRGSGTTGRRVSGRAGLAVRGWRGGGQNRRVRGRRWSVRVGRVGLEGEMAKAIPVNVECGCCSR